jgi:hypothetical protein
MGAVGTADVVVIVLYLTLVAAIAGGVGWYQRRHKHAVDAAHSFFLAEQGASCR